MFGFIPWTAVQKINKHIPTTRYVKMSPILTFEVVDDSKPTFKRKRIKHTGKSARNKQIQVILRNCKIEADDIMSVANHL